MSTPRRIDDRLFDELTRAARQTSRRRLNHFAPWAPVEGSVEAEEYLKFLTGRVHGGGDHA